MACGGIRVRVIPWVSPWYGWTRGPPRRRSGVKMKGRLGTTGTRDRGREAGQEGMGKVETGVGGTVIVIGTVMVVAGTGTAVDGEGPAWSGTVMVRDRDNGGYKDR